MILYFLALPDEGTEYAKHGIDEGCDDHFCFTYIMNYDIMQKRIIYHYMSYGRKRELAKEAILIAFDAFGCEAQFFCGFYNAVSICALLVGAGDLADFADGYFQPILF